MSRKRRPDFIKWRFSQAKEVIQRHLATGILPLTAQECPPKRAWQLYKGLPQFEDVIYDQFVVRLNEHQKQERKRRAKSAFDEAALQHDRRLYPRNEKTPKGEPVFDMSKAKYLLREDIIAGRHKSMTTFQLWKSRPEYQKFKKRNVFRQRVYQEKKTQRYYYHLERKRENMAIKEKEAAKKEKERREEEKQKTEDMKKEIIEEYLAKQNETRKADGTAPPKRRRRCS